MCAYNKTGYDFFNSSWDGVFPACEYWGAGGSKIYVAKHLRTYVCTIKRFGLFQFNLV